MGLVIPLSLTMRTQWIPGDSLAVVNSMIAWLLFDPASTCCEAMAKEAINVGLGPRSVPANVIVVVVPLWAPGRFTELKFGSAINHEGSTKSSVVAIAVIKLQRMEGHLLRAISLYL